ncbi:ABC transporter ATP-binding protein [Kaistia sp. 32K]|nr:ABC transporter ATP-binding protein [Kaistia sp. 32K]
MGATASADRDSLPEVTSETGGRLSVVTRPSAEGFNPLDLMAASLSSCIVLSVQIAARGEGWLDQIDRVNVRVIPEKADEAPSRVARFVTTVTIDGPLDAAKKAQLIEAAETICTVSNTLRAGAEIEAG